MRKQIKTIDQLKDSRILFDKQPPTFGYLLILIVEVFFILAIFWSAVTPKVYTIQAQGTVTNEDANYVMCTYTGQIEDFNLKEGQLVEKGDVLFTVTSTDYDLQEEQLIETRRAYQRQAEQYRLLVKSIKEDKNYFDESKPEDSLYYSSFETYKSKVDQCKVDTSTYKSYGYTDAQIEAELVKNQSKIEELYHTEIKAAESAIEQATLQVASLDAQLSAVISGQDAYQVKATSTGVLHLMADYKDGMVVQTGTAVATVAPENSQRIVEAYVSTADMARMEEGDKVQIVVDGLSQSVYGTITGTVKQIDSNVTTQQGQDGKTAQVFKVLIEMHSDYMVSQKGKKVDITNGMSVVARVQYDEITYLNYVLEKLGFKAK